MTSPSDAPQVQYGRLAAALILCCGMGFVLGVFFYRHWVYERRSMLDAQIAPAQQQTPGASPSGTIFSERSRAPSSLEMVHGGPGSSAGGQSNAQPAQAVTSLIRTHESVYEALAIQYTQKYPVVRAYGRDWASYPDLRKFNLQYNADHDPIKFAYHTVSSKNFAALLQKYGGRPEMVHFLVDVVKVTPDALMQASRDFLTRDGRAYDLLRRFARAAGLPDSMIQGLTQGALPDGNTSGIVVDPKLREFLQRGNVNPDQMNRDFKGQN